MDLIDKYNKELGIDKSGRNEKDGIAPTFFMNRYFGSFDDIVNPASEIVLMDYQRIMLERLEEGIAEALPHEVFRSPNTVENRARIERRHMESLGIYSNFTYEPNGNITISVEDVNPLEYINVELSIKEGEYNNVENFQRHYSEFIKE